MIKVVCLAVILGCCALLGYCAFLGCCALKIYLDRQQQQKEKQRRIDCIQKAKIGKGKLRIALRSGTDDQDYWW